MSRRTPGPVLNIRRPGLLDLLAIYGAYFRHGRSSTTVFFDLPPRVFRLLERLGLCRVQRSFQLLEALVPRVRFHEIGHDRADRLYPETHAAVMEETTTVAYGLHEELAGDPFFHAFQAVLGTEGALSFVAKTLSRTELFPLLLSARACLREAGAQEIDVWAPQGWSPPVVRRVAAQTGLPIRATPLAAPLAALGSRVLGAVTALRMVWTAIGFLVRRRVRIRPAPLSDWQLATEFIDVDHLAGDTRDADGMVDGEHLTADDFLLYLTRRQSTVLVHYSGHTHRDVAAEARRAAHTRGYELVVLDRTPYSIVHFFEITQLLVRMTWLLLTRGVTFSALAAPTFMADWLDYLPLFSSHKPRRILHVGFPNGPGTFRTNSGLVTGLSRAHGVESVGMQTRSVYLTKFEDSLDCYDLYLFWGSSFRDALGEPGNALVRNSTIVGCTTLDSLLLAACRSRTRVSDAGTTVLAFTVEITSRDRRLQSHYTYDYHRDYLLLLAEFARRHPGVTVHIKLKDPEDLRILRDDAELSKVAGPAQLPNIVFLHSERDRFREAMAGADVVSAIGFTSPGTDALLLGKPSVFYSRLGRERSHLCLVPKAVARDADSFHALLAEAIADPAAFAHKQSAGAVELDPFRDGLTMRRVASLFAARQITGELAQHFEPPKKRSLARDL